MPAADFFLRSVGLELPTLLKKPNRSEEPKYAIHTSFKVAFLRCGVHILPIVISITIIGLNLGHLFLGPQLPGVRINMAVTNALFQILAKIQEMLVVASMASIVIHVIRVELWGDGVPLGFVPAAFLFSSVSYFWSPDFWGALKARIPVWTKIRITVLVFFSGLIAVLAGPASAVLMVPRVQDWNGGGSEYYLRESNENLWPSTVTSSPDSWLCSQLNSNSTNHPFCPSGGYDALWDYVSRVPIIKNPVEPRSTAEYTYNSFSYENNFRPRSDWLSGVKLASTLNGFPDTIIQGQIRSLACETYLVGGYHYAGIWLSRLSRDWDRVVGSISWSPQRGSIAEYQWSLTKSAYTLTTVPTVRVRCSPAQNLSLIDQSVDFAIMSPHTCSGDTQQFAVDFKNTSINNNIKATWVQLPSSFGDTSAGLVLETPWSANDSSRVVVGCSIAAAWMEGISVEFIGSGLGKSPSDDCTESVIPPTVYQKPIAFAEDWLDRLTPTTPADSQGYSSSNLSTLESLLTHSLILSNLNSQSPSQVDVWNNYQAGEINRTMYLEWILGLLVTDGLARFHSSHAFDNTSSSLMNNWTLADYNRASDFQDQILHNGKAVVKPTDTDVTSMLFGVSITGYAYQASSTTDFLSIALLLGHITFALCHVFWMLYNRRSSGSWDTINELLALVQNSPPAWTALNNTCSGIKRLQTFGQVARIRAVNGYNFKFNGDMSQAAQHLELVFSEEHESDAEDGEELELICLPDENRTSSKTPVSLTWPTSNRKAYRHVSDAASDTSTTAFFQSGSESLDEFSSNVGRPRLSRIAAQNSDNQTHTVVANVLYG